MFILSCLCQAQLLNRDCVHEVQNQWQLQGNICKYRVLGWYSHSSWCVILCNLLSSLFYSSLQRKSETAISVPQHTIYDSNRRTLLKRTETLHGNNTVMDNDNQLQNYDICVGFTLECMVWCTLKNLLTLNFDFPVFYFQTHLFCI